MVTLFYVLFGKTFIEIVGSEEFLKSYEPLVILLIGYVTFLLTFWVRQLLLFNNLIIFHTYGKLIYTFSFIFFSLILSPAYGYNGIALSLTIAIIFQKLFEIRIYRKKVIQ